MMQLAQKMTMAGIAFAALAIAYNLQVQWALEPCTMCIVQRYAFMVVFVGTVGHYVLHEGYRRVWPYTSAAAVGIGLLASARIQWAISVPSVTCGRDKIAAALNGVPWLDWWPTMFEATGVCGDKVAPVLGLPFHAWSAILFVALGVLLWKGRAAAQAAVVKS
jgi:disulfide bond formation protein DsbB